jgi:acetyltransferase-like isoleucine patch superfamily enzyme
MGKTMGKTILGFVKAPRIPWFVLKRLRVLKSEFRQWSYTLILAAPGRFGARIRRRWLPFGKMGNNVRLDRGSWFEHPENITIGDDTGANRYCFIHAGGGVDIGCNVMLGPFVTIYSQNHNWRERSVNIADQGRTRAKVVIEDDVWLCAGSVVLPGVKVRRGTVVAAGAVVTRDTEAYSIVGGIPAVKIGERADSAETLSNLLAGAAVRIMTLLCAAPSWEWLMVL